MLNLDDDKSTWRVIPVRGIKGSRAFFYIKYVVSNFYVFS